MIAILLLTIDGGRDFSPFKSNACEGGEVANNLMKSVSLPKLFQQFQLPQIIVLGFLLLLLGIGAIPGYFSGHWPWAHLPRVTHLNQLRNLRQTGLTLPGWQTIKQQIVPIGGHKWSLQQLQGDTAKPVVLLLFPQNGDKDQPQVEWMDVDGVMAWKTDSYRQLQFTVEPSSLTGVMSQIMPHTVEARFFRAWQQQPSLAQTFAVLQWYAWPGGGNPAPSQWFWLDQRAQWRRQRVPWVAVCLQIPIEPLGDIEASRSLAESLGKKIQATLMADTFKNVKK